MKFLIIEDEKRTAHRLEKMLLRIEPQARILATLHSVEAARQWLSSPPDRPDTVLLDVDLGDGLSFELIEQNLLPYPTIFTTAFDQYAMKAFEAHSISYLLKPIQEAELQRALEKRNALGKILQHEPVVVHNLGKIIRGETSPYQARFLIRLAERYEPVSVEDVAYFYIENRITFAQLFSGKRYPVDFSLEQLEERLHPRSFFRVNRQLTVNAQAVAGIEPYPKSRVRLQLTPAAPFEIVVSSEKTSTFKQWYQGLA